MSPVQTIPVQEKVIYVHEQDAVIITIRLYRVTRQDDFFEIITNLVQRGRFLGNLLVNVKTRKAEQRLSGIVRQGVREFNHGLHGFSRIISSICVALCFVHRSSPCQSV